ncbi:MAG: LysR family transcriptional regulator [Bacteriovoracaceae bacterium]
MQQLYLKDHIEKLYPFKIIADLGGLTAAAQALGVGQSGLSHSLKSLEDILETTLFIRQPRGIALTAEGKILYEFSKTLFHLVDQIELQIKNTGKEQIGILKIATHETLATHIWPTFMKKAVSLFPHIEVSLTSGRIDPIIHDVLNGSVDIALTVEPLNDPKLLVTPIYTGDFGFYTFAKDKRKSISVRELDDIPILTDNQAHFKQGMPIPQYLALSGLKLKRSFSLNSFEAAISLSASEVGICTVPKRNAMRAVSEGKIKEIKVKGLMNKPFGTYTICATYLKSSQNKMIQPFVAELVKYIKILS